MCDSQPPLPPADQAVAARQAIQRIAELEALLSSYRAATEDAHAVLTAAGVPTAKRVACADPACQTQLGHRVRALVAERDAARARGGREWKDVLTWLIEDTEERLGNIAEPNVAFYNGKLSALTYLLTLAQEDMDATPPSSARKGAGG